MKAPDAVYLGICRLLFSLRVVRDRLRGFPLPLPVLYEIIEDHRRSHSLLIGSVVGVSFGAGSLANIGQLSRPLFDCLAEKDLFTSHYKALYEQIKGI